MEALDLFPLLLHAHPIDVGVMWATYVRSGRPGRAAPRTVTEDLSRSTQTFNATIPFSEQSSERIWAHVGPAIPASRTPIAKDAARRKNARMLAWHATGPLALTKCSFEAAFAVFTSPPPPSPMEQRHAIFHR